MNRFAIVTCLFLTSLFVTRCNEVEKVVESPKVQQDSENLVNDFIHEAEDVLEAETGVKVDVQLPKGPPQ